MFMHLPVKVDLSYQNISAHILRHNCIGCHRDLVAMCCACVG
jgi:hypothetical protein